VEMQTTGTVIAVIKQWWLKINTKPVRRHSTDGAIFPHVIRVQYTADGMDHICKKWIPASQKPPAIGSKVTVSYRQDKPSKAKVYIQTGERL